MKLAPIVRTEFDSVRQQVLDQVLLKSSVKINKLQYRDTKGRKSGPTWPLNKDSDVELIGK